MFILEAHVVPGNVYKVSYKYKANADNSKFGLSFVTGAYHNIWPERQVCGTSEVAADTANGEWVEKTIYFTAMTTWIIKDEIETGIDYVNKESGRDTLYAIYYQDANENGNDVEFIDFEVVDLGVGIAASGASVLTDGVAEAVGQQAMRYYFDYKTDDGRQIYLGDDEVLTVVKRGFLYANGNADDGRGTNGIAGDGKITSYESNWIEYGEAKFRNLTSSSVYSEKSDKVIKEIQEKYQSVKDSYRLTFKKIFVLFTDRLFEIDGDKITRYDISDEELENLQEDFDKIIKQKNS
jgi:hypothetical protein